MLCRLFQNCLPWDQQFIVQGVGFTSDMTNLFWPTEQPILVNLLILTRNAYVVYNPNVILPNTVFERMFLNVAVLVKLTYPVVDFIVSFM